MRYPPEDRLMVIYEERWDLGKLVTFVPNKKTPIYNWFFL